MRTNDRQQWVRCFALMMLFGLGPFLVACATSTGLQRGNTEAKLGNWDAAVRYYQRAVQENPGDKEAQIRLERAKGNAARNHRQQGLQLRDSGDLERALLEYELAVRLVPSEPSYVAGLQELRELVAEQVIQRGSQTPLEEVIERSRTAASVTPQLEPEVSGPISLNFRRAGIKAVYRALARLGGINVLFDPGLRGEKTGFNVADVSFEQALEILTSAHGHFRKVLSPTTVLIVPDTAANRRQYADQVLRTFYLSNAEAESTGNALRTLLQAQRVAEDLNLNSVTIRDTPEVVEVAERIVGALDKARGEVLLDVEVFEVNRSVMEEYGLSLSQYSTVGTLAQGANGISLQALEQVTENDLFVTIPSVRYQFFKEHNDFKLIAQPQLRASEGQETNLLIGQRVPIVTTTFNPQNTSGGDVIPIATTNYEDVGIIIATSPRVHHNGEITLQLQIEISAVIGESTVQNLPIFSSRTLSTTIRLRDGQTNLLAGLLREDERTALRGLPILMDLPIIGKLFSSTKQDVVQTDIVLSITPHILRMAEITQEDLEAVYVGTEANISGGGRGSRRGGRGGDEADEDDEALQDPVVVELLPAELDMFPGRDFRLDINLEGNQEIYSAGLRVSFDPTSVEFLRAEEGSLLNGDGSDTSYQAARASQGNIAIGLSRMGEVGGVLSSGTLATLVFQVLAPGQSEISVGSAAIRSADGQPLPVEFRPARLRVEEP